MVALSSCLDNNLHSLPWASLPFPKIFSQLIQLLARHFESGNVLWGLHHAILLVVELVDLCDELLDLRVLFVGRHDRRGNSDMRASRPHTQRQVPPQRSGPVRHAAGSPTARRVFAMEMVYRSPQRTRPAPRSPPLTQSERRTRPTAIFTDMDQQEASHQESPIRKALRRLWMDPKLREQMELSDKKSAMMQSKMKAAKCIYLAIVIDGTMSMRKHLELSVRKLRELAESLSHLSEDMELHVAIVVFRDAIHRKESTRNERLPFTKVTMRAGEPDMTAFDSFMAPIVEHPSGGLDTAEDYVSALKILDKLLDDTPAAFKPREGCGNHAPVKMAFVTGDSCNHGDIYWPRDAHGRIHWAAPPARDNHGYDQFPEGDHGVPEILLQLHKRSVSLWFAHIHLKNGVDTRTFVEQANRLVAQRLRDEGLPARREVLQSLELTTPDMLGEVLKRSVSLTIQASMRPDDEPHGDPAKKPRGWTPITRCGEKLEARRPTADFMSIRKEAKAWDESGRKPDTDQYQYEQFHSRDSDRFTAAELTRELSKLSERRGAASAINGQDLQIRFADFPRGDVLPKELADPPGASRFAWRVDVGQQACIPAVLKQFHKGANKTEYLAVAQMQMVAQQFAEAFNKETCSVRSEHHEDMAEIIFVDAFVLDVAEKVCRARCKSCTGPSRARRNRSHPLLLSRNAGGRSRPELLPRAGAY